MRTVVVWFKTDLRLHDNETLIKAIAQSDAIIPVYCFDESQFGITDFGFQKTGSFRAQFLLESILDLDKNLRAVGSGLVVLKGKPEVEIPKIVAHYKANKVVAKREVSYEERQTEALVQEALFKLKCELQTSVLVPCIMLRIYLFRLKIFQMYLPISEKEQKKMR